MKRLVVLAAAVLLLAGLAAPVQAASIVFTLNCNMQFQTNHPHNYTGCPQSGPYGTITLTDSQANSNWIDITVALIAPWDEVSKFYLNLDPGFSKPSNYTFSLTGAHSVDLYNEGPGTYNFLDMELDPNNTSTPWSGTLKLKKDNNSSTYYDLNVGLFNFQDVNGLWAAATIGQCDWLDVGSKNPVTPMPEPGSMILLGSGLIGLAGVIRRRMRK